MAVSFTLSSITSDSVIVNVKVDPSYGYYRVFCRLADDEDDTTYDSGVFSASDNFQEPIDGLYPETKYAVNVGYNNTGGNNVTWLGKKTFTTKSEAPEIYFEWTYAGLNENGSPVAGASKKAGLGVYVTANEWNELISCINQKMGTSLSGVTRGTEISAAIVNRAASALGVKTVSKDSPITASFFNQLMNKVNA